MFKNKKESNLQIGYLIIKKKMISEIGFFQIKKYFIWMGYITLKMTEYRQLIAKKLIKKDGEAKKHTFPAKVMVWLGVCASGLTKLVIFEKGTINHEYYINKILSIALK